MTAITVGNLKGGVGKTTSAVHLALGLSQTGRTLFVDTDPQQSGTKWAQLAGQTWPYDHCVVVSWSDPRTLARQIQAVRADYDHIVVDVPPSRSRRGHEFEAELLEAALEATGNLLVPTSTSGLDLAEIGDTFEVASRVNKRRDVYTAVLLVRVLLSTRSATVARDVLSEDIGYHVLSASVPARESIAQALGTVPLPLRGPYADVLAEILTTYPEEP